MNQTNIRRYRKQKKMSQSLLASLAEIPQTTLSGWEIGIQDNHPVSKAIRLAQILETTVEYLFKEQHRELFAPVPGAQEEPAD